MTIFEKVIKLEVQGGTIASRGWRGQVQQVHKLCSEDFNPSP